MSSNELRARYMRDYTRKNRDTINPRRRERDKERRAAGSMPRRRCPKSPCIRCGGTDRYASGSCKPCTREADKRRMQERPELVRAQANERGRRHRARLDPEVKRQRNRVQNLRRMSQAYGLAAGEYDAMNEAQGGLCAICNSAQPGRHLHVDHNHDTGIVRALLCGNCNTAIGLMGENTELLAAAIRYLDQHKESDMPAFTITSAA